MFQFSSKRQIRWERTASHRHGIQRSGAMHMTITTRSPIFEAEKLKNLRLEQVCLSPFSLAIGLSGNRLNYSAFTVIFLDCVQAFSGVSRRSFWIVTISYHSIPFLSFGEDFRLHCGSFSASDSRINGNVASSAKARTAQSRSSSRTPKLGVDYTKEVTCFFEI